MKTKKTFIKLMKEKGSKSHFSGVFSGISKYFGVNVNLLRVVFIIVIFVFGFIPILFYFLSNWVILEKYDQNYDLEYLDTIKKKKTSKLKENKNIKILSV